MPPPLAAKLAKRSKPELCRCAIEAATLEQLQCRSTLLCPRCCKAREANTARFRERRAEGQRRGGVSGLSRR
jgi:hypothetical protein